jgi:hypothetical protein
VRAAAQLAHSGDTPFARRAYVRSAFALVEGNLNLMAEVILGVEGRNEIRLSKSEQGILPQERQIPVQTACRLSA